MSVLGSQAASNCYDAMAQHVNHKATAAHLYWVSDYKYNSTKYSISFMKITQFNVH